MAEYSGTPGFGKLKDVTAIDLGAWALKGALARTGIKPEMVDDTVIGNALQTTERRDLRRAPRRAEGRRADREARR
jgi:acetyl-CoA C-acetyltransferase